MRIERFEDIQSWQKARELNKIIYLYTKKEKFCRDYGLIDQIRRATVSIMSNIAEGFERQTNVELSRFLFIAKGSCGEVRSQLYIALDQGYITRGEFDVVYNFTVEISKLLSKFITYLKTKTL